MWCGCGDLFEYCWELIVIGYICNTSKKEVVRLPRYQGHSENPFITRNKRYELVERDLLGKRHHLTIRSIAN